MAIAQGDLGSPRQGAAAFDEYVRTHAARWLRLTTLLAGSPAAAEDLLQAALEKLWRRWDAARATDSLDGYMYSIIVNTWRSWRRLRWSHEKPTPSIREASSEEDVADDVVRRENLRRALNQLPVRQKATVVLRYYLDLSVEETARILECSEGTVKSQSADALRNLRSALANAAGPRT